MNAPQVKGENKNSFDSFDQIRGGKVILVNTEDECARVVRFVTSFMKNSGDEVSVRQFYTGVQFDVNVSFLGYVIHL